MKYFLKTVLLFAVGIVFITLTSNAQNDKKLRLTFVLSENSNAKSVKCNLSFDPVYFFVVGMPVLLDEKTNEKNEIDYEFKNERVVFDGIKRAVIWANDIKLTGKFELIDALNKELRIFLNYRIRMDDSIQIILKHLKQTEWECICLHYMNL